MKYIDLHRFTFLIGMASNQQLSVGSITPKLGSTKGDRHLSKGMRAWVARIPARAQWFNRRITRTNTFFFSIKMNYLKQKAKVFSRLYSPSA